MLRSRGFTLIEVVLAVFILMLLLMVAVPSLTGVLADRRLRASLDRFNRLVAQAREHSVTEHRPYLMVIGAHGIDVRPEVVTKDDDPAPVAELPLQNREVVKLTFPAALRKNPPPEWIFWPSGACEPAVVQFITGNGSWSATYSPLTAHADLLKYAPR